MLISSWATGLEQSFAVIVCKSVWYAKKKFLQSHRKWENGFAWDSGVCGHHESLKTQGHEHLQWHPSGSRS